MRIFLDANILVSVLNKEYPLFTYSARILSLADKKRFSFYTSPVCLAISFYFAEKKYSTQVAKNKIRLLAQHINISPTTIETVNKALDNPAVNDFEDGLEYYAALASKCDCIITEDTQDFYFSDIEVVNSENFFKKHLTAKA